MQKSLKNFLLLLMLFITIGSTQSFGQRKAKTKAKTHKVKRSSSESSDYYNGNKIYTGPRGGRYYINSNGKKTYI
jgi:colicin import membrane protein